MKWLKGLIAALIGGGANAVTVMIVDPADFNLAQGWQKLLSVAAVGAILNVAMYLKQSPVPADDDSFVNRMAKSVPLVLLALGLSLTLGCRAPVTIVTPQGKIAYTADQITLRVQELERAAISADAANLIPTATARVLVSFCVGAGKTLAATPVGWRASIDTAWTTAKAQIPPVTNPAVLSAMGAIDVVLAVEGGQ